MSSGSGTRATVIALVGLVLVCAVLVVELGFKTERASPPREAQARASEHIEPSRGGENDQRHGQRVAAAIPPRGGDLEIDVGYDDGTVGRGVAVRIHTPGGDPRVGVRRAVTDADGTCAFHDVPAGEWLIRVDRAYVTRDAIARVTAGRTTRVGIVIQVKLVIRGRVVSDRGEPVPSALLVLAPMSSRGYDPAGVEVADELGRFMLKSGMNPAMLGARAAGFGPSPMLMVDGAHGSLVEGVELVLPRAGGDVQGLVMSRAGRPIRDAIVRIGAGGPVVRPVERVAPAPPAQVLTDEAGRYLAIGVPQGRHPVTVRAAGFAPWTGSCVVTRGERTVCDVTLLPGCRVRGRVVDTEGQPLPGCTVSAHEPGDLRRVQVVTAEDGLYCLEDLAAGRQTIGAYSRKFGKSSIEVECQPGDDTVRDIVLDPGTVLAGQVRSTAGAPVSAAVYVWQDAESPASNVPRWGSGGNFTDREGRFWVTNVPDGPVNVRVSGLRIVDREFRRIDAGEGEVVLEVEVKEAPSVTIRGMVVDPYGTPIGHADVSVLTMEGARKVRVDIEKTQPRTGIFECGPLPPDRYEVRVEPLGYPRYVSDWRVVEPFEVWDLGTITAEQGGYIRTVMPEPPVPGLTAAIWEERGEWVKNIRSTDVSPPLAGGTYLVRIHGPEVAEHTRRVDVVPGEATELRVEVERGYRCHLELDRGDADTSARLFTLEVARPGTAGLARPSAWPVGEPVFIEERWLPPGSNHVRVELGGERMDATITVLPHDELQVFRIPVGR